MYCWLEDSSRLWVAAPLSSSNNTLFYIYYNKEDNSSNQPLGDSSCIRLYRFEDNLND